MSINWLALVKALAPTIIAATVPHGDLLAPLVVQGITEAESAVGKSGAEKLAIAQKVVDTGIAGVNAAAGRQKIDPVAVHQIVAEGISTTVDIVNQVHAKVVPQTADLPSSLNQIHPLT